MNNSELSKTVTEEHLPNGTTVRTRAMQPVAQGGAAHEEMPADFTADAVARSPMPASPIPGKTLLDADPELYAAWRDHMRRGFENNQVMFEQVLAGFMNPYWTTV